MGVRHAGFAVALVVAAYGQLGTTLPAVAQPGSGAPHGTPAVHRTWYVNGVRGSDKNSCETAGVPCKTIGHAISLTSPGDSVVVAAATYPENLTIPHNLRIIGAGAATTIIDGGGVASEIVNSGHRAVVAVSGLTFRGGNGPGDGGGLYNCMSTMTITDSVIAGNGARQGAGALGYGGGIYNCPGSTLTISDTTFRDNRAEAGGAICNGGTLTISGSTFTGNVARFRRGGAIFNYGTLTIDNSTFTGNRVRHGTGGAIHNGQLFGAVGTLVISNSTISGNTAGDGGGGIYTLAGVSTRIGDSIVAGNASGNCGGLLTSLGYNLSSDATCDFGATGDVSNTDPRLGPLQNNGGPTPTMALRSGSPAIDAGDPAGCTDGHGHLLTTDQRGAPRPDPEDTGGCDMGAYEHQGD
jgi:predicted outer membrane repeat protein